MNAFSLYPRANPTAAALAPSRSGLISLLLVACFAACLPARAQLYTESSTINADAAGAAQGFGATVAASGNTLVAGNARPTSSARPFVTRGYVYVRDATGWALQQQIDFATNDVAVDGDTLVGGGAIYVRSGSTWTLQHTVYFDHPRPALQGDTLVVGNPYDRTQERGGVYVFVRNGSTWTQQAALGPDGAATREMMGDSVALDGDTLLAGTGSSSGPGGAYVFVRNGTTWTQQARLALPTGAGWMKVALEGDTAAVSDPANNKICIFTRSGTTWTLAQTLTVPEAGRDFGYKLSLNGGILAAGTDYAFHMYARTASGWVLAQTLPPSGYAFEGGLAVANQGKLVVTGNPYSSKVDIFSAPPAPAPGSGWRDLDIGAVGVAGGSTTSGSQVTVRGSGADIWNAADQFHFRTESLTGDGAIIARVDSIGAGHPWSKAGLMFREDIAPAARNVMALVTAGGPVGLQSRGATADTTNFVNAGWLGSPIWLMLARSGNLFAGYRSNDGQNWTPMGSATVKMPPTIHVGLAITSHDNATINTGAFSGIEIVSTQPPPPPSAALTGNDLGAVAVTGSFTDSDGTLTIDAAGADIWNQADSGYFVHREITGDFDLRARITSLTNTHPWAKAGLMVRESLAAGSRNIFTLLTAGNTCGTQVRETTDGATSFTSGPWVNAPYWVRLVRTGNTFQSMVSGDGSTWQTVGTQTLALPATLQAGVAVSSHVANTKTHVTVTGIELGGTPPPPPPPDTLTGSNLGPVTPPGAFSNASGVITIDAAGADIWNEADNGYFVNREISGDFDIRARIASLANTHAWAKAGLMVRESLAPQSRNVFTMLSAAAAAGMQVRATTGAATTFNAGPWVTAPYWVRLVRTGNNFQSLISQNGTTWQSVGTTSLALPATVRAGIGVSSHVANTTTRATVESLDLGH